jgi:hypothetical protein
MRRQPISQREQATDRGLKLGDLLDAIPTLVRDAHTRGDLRLVHTKRRRALHHRLHHASLPAR